MKRTVVRGLNNAGAILHGCDIIFVANFPGTGHKVCCLGALNYNGLLSVTFLSAIARSDV
ncbi:hypothetical protein A6J66_006190 [Yersinia enterocolitica]|nr:hypothetical protein A6J66_006190 [Yersinia enterocolitica]